MSLLPQFGFFELVVVGLLALIVVGPKDLPKLMRSAGKAVAKMRAMAAEFTSAFDQMAREAEMEEMREEIERLKTGNVFTETKRALDEAVEPINKAVRDEANEVKDALKKPSVSEDAPLESETAPANPAASS